MANRGRATRSPKRRCVVCNQYFLVAVGRRGSLPKTCSDECRQARRDETNRDARIRKALGVPSRRKRGAPRPYEWADNCIVCGDANTPAAVRGRFCTTACYSKIAHLEKTYGLTEQQAVELRNRPNCDACGKPASGEMHVDHCHETGVVRGRLHGSCNTGIGQACDDSEQLHAWGTYLARHRLDLRDYCTKAEEAKAA